MIDVSLYHWAWYLFGMWVAPGLTAMIFVQIHLAKELPVWLVIWLWIAVIMHNGLVVSTRR
jgi:hypothetical protein